jgi:hypothetical protein
MAGSMADAILTLRALNRAVLARQMLLRREKVKVVSAVERLGGLQAQVARPPFVGLWTRVEGFTREDLIRAIDTRAIVRATLMRATLHLMTRKDFLALRASLQPMLSRGMEAVLRERTKGVDIARLVPAARAYFEEEPRTFNELRDHLGQQFPGLDERAMGYMVRTHLPLVQTPAAGQAWAYPSIADFAVAESWLDDTLAEDARPHGLILRYLGAFGPASVRDFEGWSALRDAAPAFEELRPKLRTFRDERKRELFDLPNAPRPDEDEEAPVRLLPEFDNLLLAYADRRRIAADEHKPFLCSKNLLIPGTVLVDGTIAATWKVESKKRTARLVVTPLVALSKKARTPIAEEGERMLRFMEPTVDEIAVDFSAKA